MEDVSGRSAFITGGGSGIGLSIALAFARAGVRVMIADLREDNLEAAKASFADAGLDAPTVCRLDISERAAFPAIADQARAAIGRTDILVCNAGVGINGPIAEATFADWDFGVGVNLGGTINTMQTFLPGMIADGQGGHIVVTASQAGLAPAPRNAAIYGMTKAGLIALCEGMRDEMADYGIGISAFIPGFYRTAITGTGRYRPERFRAGSGYGGRETEAAGMPESPLFHDLAEAGEKVLDGVRRNALWIPTHGELKGWTEGRFERILAAYPPAADEALARAVGKQRPPNPFAVRAEG
jgi:NAD(P)-dependent dehydrogenase (short-subunit alcohol dehydrogenase family)